MISDLAGRAIHSGTVTNNRQQVDLGRLSKGTYVLQVNDRERRWSFKFIKQNS